MSAIDRRERPERRVSEVSEHLCECGCGERTMLDPRTRQPSRFRRGHHSRIHNRKHGMHGTPTYASWLAMHQRCENPNATAYERYGGVGVTICDRWSESFEAFLEDMGERPAGKTLDRFPDPAGNYEPGNCRWATPKEQAANKRPLKTHCKWGHEFTPENTRINGNGARACRACARRRANDAYAAKIGR